MQDAVAGVVAPGVVDALEVVDIDQPQRERHAQGAARALDLAQEAGLEFAPVVEPREGIGAGPQAAGAGGR